MPSAAYYEAVGKQNGREVLGVRGVFSAWKGLVEDTGSLNPKP